MWMKKDAAFVCFVYGTTLIMEKCILPPDGTHTAAARTLTLK